MGPIYTRLAVQQKWENDVPLKFLWTIDIYPRSGSDKSIIGRNVNRILEKYERYDRFRWPVSDKIINVQSDNRGLLGYLFGLQVGLPGDSFIINDAPIDNMGGFIPAYVASNRTGYNSQNKIDITFMETNIDIIDYLIRPWIIAASHKGLIDLGPRDPEDIKCNIILSYYTRDRDSYVSKLSGRSIMGNSMMRMQLRKVFQFYNAVPFMTQGDSISYGELTLGDIQKTASFAFSHYDTIDFTQSSRNFRL